jgi:PPOX class probable F420-dependent enzyme
MPWNITGTLPPQIVDNAEGHPGEPMILPENLRQTIDSRAFAHLATLDADGAPHVTAMWIGREGDRILFNTLRGRAKWHHLQRDRRVAVSISPADDLYVNYSIKGRVVEMRTDDGVEVINRLAHKYLDRDFPLLRPGDVRVTIVVEATSIASNA